MSHPTASKPTPAEQARAIAKLGGTAAAHLEAARLVSLARDVMACTGTVDIPSALAKVKAGMVALESAKTKVIAPSKPARSTLQLAGGGDEAGLAARASASGMTIDDRRAAEANQRRCAAQEAKRLGIDLAALAAQAQLNTRKTSR